FHRLFNPIGALVGLFDQVQSAGASLTRMVGVIIEAESSPRREAGVDRAAGGADGLSVSSGSSVRPGPTLVLEDLWFTYDKDPASAHQVVRGVSLRIEPGEVVAVVGTTGAGKSTLARTAAGLSVPTRGRAELVVSGGD
ncbi:ABC transporter ATP-binding protein, partial [Burkholderia multivorans]